eukprot:scaffold4607_cov85-Isochrysis_galbana.AAC.3
MSALPVTKRYAKSHGQAYLNSDGFVGLINGSLHRFRPTLSEGIPDGPIDFALNAAGVTGLPATIARSVANHVARRGAAPGITLLRRPPSARHALPCLLDNNGVLALSVRALALQAQGGCIKVLYRSPDCDNGRGAAP